MAIPLPVVKVADVITIKFAAVAAVAAMSIIVPVVVPTSMDAEVRRKSEPPEAITPAVWFTLIAVPVRSAPSVIRNKFAAVAAVDERFKREPVVVAVSMDVDDALMSAPPDAITDVVWVMFTSLPVVRAFAAIDTALPVVSPARVINMIVPVVAAACVTVMNPAPA